jgi:pullulanase
MATLNEIQSNLTFLNTGPNQIPGLVVMKLDANGGDYGPFNHIVVVFNATNAQVSFTDPQLQGLPLHLHPIQRFSSDSATRESSFNSQQGTAVVPALTTAVFVADADF